MMLYSRGGQDFERRASKVSRKAWRAEVFHQKTLIFMLVLNLITQDRPMKMALPWDQPNHFAVETFLLAIYN